MKKFIFLFVLILTNLIFFILGGIFFGQQSISKLNFKNITGEWISEDNGMIFQFSYDESRSNIPPQYVISQNGTKLKSGNYSINTNIVLNDFLTEGSDNYTIQSISKSEIVLTIGESSRIVLRRK